MKLVLALIAFMVMILFAPTAIGQVGTKKVQCAEYTAMWYVGGCSRESGDRLVSKDVDNEKAEEKTERRGEEYENEAQEEKHETKAEEQAEQVTSREPGGSEGSGN